MAALDLPWMSHVQMPMSPAKTQRGDTADSLRPPSTPSRLPSFDGGPPSTPNPTYAAFSPATLSSSSAAKRRSTVLVHQKSPLLLATPPQITRALAYSHPFLLPLNKLAGLLTWTTGDPWESFLLVAAWWAVVLYGSIVVRLAGPIVLVLALIAGMYGRRYSPLSSSGWSDEPANTNRPTRAAKTRGAAAADGSGSSSSNGGGGGGAKADSTGGGGGGGGSAHQRSTSEVTNTRHQKTLDEIVETLKEFTGRCNMLLEPLLELTDFLSTQRTPTSATTRPALTTLFVRILLCTPVWAALTLPPLRIVTARRVVVVVGTVGLTWHARPMRVSRTILWRSAALRRFAALVTGLPFEGPLAPSSSAAAAKQLLAAESSGLSTATTAVGSTSSAAAAASKPAPQESELTKAIRRARGGHDAGVRFTFILYENQRRWVGLGWTTSLFAYERGPWADEHNHAVPPRDQFELPGVNEHGSRMRWRWVEGSRWRVDGVPDDAVRGMAKADGDTEDKWDYDGPGGKMGWVYYDNKWQNGRRGQDGWGRWTRRRKWYRDAELVEADPEESSTPVPASQAPAGESPPAPALPARPTDASPSLSAGTDSPAEGPSVPGLALDDAASTDGRPARERAEEDDTLSVLSSSSRSTRFRMPSLRRRATDTAASASASATGPAAVPATTAAHASGSTSRPRRPSSAASEEDAAALGTQLELEMQGAGKEGWGIGDEARMGLE